MILHLQGDVTDDVIDIEENNERLSRFTCSMLTLQSVYRSLRFINTLSLISDFISANIRCQWSHYQDPRDVGDRWVH